MPTAFLGPLAARRWLPVLAQRLLPAARDTAEPTDPYLLPWSGRPQSGRPQPTTPAAALPAYITPEGRDLRIDVLRGFFVLAMIIDHVRGASPLYLLTGGNRFFVSAAEGFILTSGLLAGLVYRRVVSRDGLAAAVRKIWSRATTLYLVTIALTLLLLPISELLGLPWAQGIHMDRPLELVISVLTLHQTYYLADVLLLYTVLFLVTPAAILLMVGGKTKILVGSSVLLWGVQQFFPHAVVLPWPIAGNLLFTFSAWQLLFFAGLGVGYQRDRIPALTRRGAARLQLVTGVATAAMIAVYAFLQTPHASLPGWLAGFAGPWQVIQTWLEQYAFGKVDLRPGRVLAAAVVFTFLFLTITRQWRFVKRSLSWLLSPLGQNSLYAFIAHVVAVAVVALALQPFGMTANSPWWLNAILQIVSVLVIWLSTRRHLLEPTHKTLVWRASPIAIALLVVILLPFLPQSTAHARPAAAAATPAISEAILARARAYGTPVTSLRLTAAGQPAVADRGSAAVADRGWAAATIATPAAPRSGFAPVLPPTALAVGAAPAVARSVSLPATATPQAPASQVELRSGIGPTSAPAAIGTVLTAHSESVSLSLTSTPQPSPTPAPQAPALPGARATATSVPAVSQLLINLLSAIHPAQPTAEVVTSQPEAVQVSPGAVDRAVGAAQPAKTTVHQPAITLPSAGPLPVLPPDSEHLLTEYIGPLRGSIYSRSLRSDLLGRDLPYWVYLPPDYGQVDRRYPVLYMLHGGGGVLDEWAALGIFEAADAGIAAGTLPPMIIVLPQGDKSYFANWAGDSQRWGDYMAYEVVGAVDASFATLADRSGRAIGGLSMGGWGALHQAFTHPDIFSTVGAHSPSLYPDDNALKFLGIGAEFASKSPDSLAGFQPHLDTLHIWIDIGANDPWLAATTALHDTLAGRGIEHQWHTNPGNHESAYWAERLPTYLAFYGQALGGK